MDQEIFQSIFASFGLPEPSLSALANEALFSVIAQYLSGCKQ
jgi:hypothetical protein